MKLCIPLVGMLAALLGALAALTALALQVRDIAAGSRGSVDAYIFIALGLAALGLYGARLALRHPRLSCTVMATAAVGGVLSLAWLFALPALLFSLASALGFLWRNEAPPSLRQG